MAVFGVRTVGQIMVQPRDSRAKEGLEEELRILLGMIGGLTLLAAGAGVANFMYVAVHERTMEIGVKLAAGAAGAWLVGMIPTEHEVLVYLVHPQVSWPIGVATALTLALIGLLAGVFPAHRAAAMDPVEALRYE